jgi:3-dehydroshikimate dehydratase
MLSILGDLPYTGLISKGTPMTRASISGIPQNISRRHFLAHVGIGGVALPLGVVCSAASARSSRSPGAGELPTRTRVGPKVGLCTIAFQERPLIEVLELAARAGIDGVEPWGKADHLPLSTPDSRVREVKARLDDLGLLCSHFGSYVRLGEEREAALQETDMRRAIAIAQLLGTNIIRIWAGAKNSEDLNAAELDHIISDGKKFCALAEKEGVLLAMEMHGQTLTNRASAMIDLIRRVGSPSLKANFQILNDTEDPYERARSAGPYAVMVHAQNEGAPGEGQPLICKGVVDFQKIWEILSGFGFKGYFEVEFVKGKTLKEKVDNLKQDCACLKAIGASQ